MDFPLSRDGAAVPDCGECVAVTENVAHNTGQLLYHAGGVRAGVVDKRVKVSDNVEQKKVSDNVEQKKVPENVEQKTVPDNIAHTTSQLPPDTFY